MKNFKYYKSWILVLTLAFLLIFPSLLANARLSSGPYQEILSANKGAENYVGDKITETISFDIPLATEYGQVNLHYSTTIQAAEKASVYAASAIGASFNANDQLISTGENGDFETNSYDGITCDHTMIVQSIDKKPTIKQTWYGIEIDYTYVVHGYYWKHGWLCSDQQIPFNLDVSSYAQIYQSG
ncbi:MAG: hypothetical protein GSR79_00790 [Desulfurococcales archaeon]|nr:hypothetical protein [Desulfurococcales archaeon]